VVYVKDRGSARDSASVTAGSGVGPGLGSPVSVLGPGG